MDNTKVIKAIIAGCKGYGKVRAAVRKLFESGDSTADFQACVDGLLDINCKVTDEENAPFRSFKATVSTLAKEYGKVVSIKQGTIVITDAVAASEPAAGESEGEGEGQGLDKPGDAHHDEAQADALWSAVELVLANLGNVAILSAIKSGLDKLAAGR